MAEEPAQEGAPRGTRLMWVRQALPAVTARAVLADKLPPLAAAVRPMLLALASPCNAAQSHFLCRSVSRAGTAGAARALAAAECCSAGARHA